jgi:hypothetical protein
MQLSRGNGLMIFDTDSLRYGQGKRSQHRRFWHKHNKFWFGMMIKASHEDSTALRGGKEWMTINRTSPWR